MTAETYAGASQGAIKLHYDVGNEFWRLWLDPTMTYSCAMYETGEEKLEDAQRRKLDYLIEGARASGKARVLDVGCGWGSCLRRLTDDHGVEHAVGLTLSRAQHEWITSQGNPRQEVHVQGWADYEPDDQFDAIISIGAFEHFASLGLSRDDRIGSYRNFFERCHRWLRPGGRIGLQTIAKGEVSLDVQGLRDTTFIMRQIFRESDLPQPADVLLACEGRFELVSLRNDRTHYVRTCEDWLARLRANREAALEVVDEQVFRRYERYLEACIRQFDRGHATLLRFVLERIDPGEPLRLGKLTGSRS